MSTMAISGRNWIADMVHWLVMVLAMMLPLVIDPIRGVAARSLWPRRHRAVGGFLLGYLSVWLVAGIVISLAIAEVRLDHHLRNLPAVAVAFAVAALWQLTPAKRWAIRACHKTLPIAPCGWRADRDCFRYGLMIGTSCLVSCWALMAACSMAGHSIAAMTFGASAGVAERYFLRPGRGVLPFTASFAALRAAITLV
jgi:predicted metal-binding membrane protein